MSDCQFTPAQRLAIFTVHRDKCYICRKPLDYASMEIDHIVPEHLVGDPAELARVLESLGRPAEFNVNSYENWLPSCWLCNGQKSGTPFDLAPIVIIQLQKAKVKADDVRLIENKTVTDHRLGKAIALVEVKGMMAVRRPFL